MRHPTLRGIVTLGVLGILTACGGSDSVSGPSGNSLTSAEAQLVVANLFTEISKALASGVVTTAASPTAARAAAAPTTIKETLSSTCAAGGTVTGTYTFTSDFNQQGAGTESGSVTVTTNACQVSTGSRTIAVGGSFSLTFNVTYANFAPASNFTWNETGNFTWSGGSCAINYTAVVTPQGKQTVTGSVCGQSISYST